SNPNNLSATPEEIQSRTGAQLLLFTILEASLRLVHPVCPFISEEIWQVLRGMVGEDLGFNSPGMDMSTRVATPEMSASRADVIEGVVNPNGGHSDTLGSRTLGALESSSIMIAPWVAFDTNLLKDKAAVDQMNVLQQVLYAVRNIRGEMRITPGVAASILLVTPDEAVRKLLNDHANFFTTLTNV